MASAGTRRVTRRSSVRWRRRASWSRPRSSPPPPPAPPGNIGDVYNGNQSQDVSEVLTRTLALNTTPGSPFAGRLDTATGVGVAGHSLGGMTTHGLLTAWPDERIVAAVPFATVHMGNPSGRVAANVLFVHGDQDPICQYSSARQAYNELPAPKRSSPI